MIPSMAKSKTKTKDTPAASAGRSFGPWEILEDKNGIKLEGRKNRKSGILETRVSAVIDGSTDKLYKALTTPKTLVELMPKMVASRDSEEDERKRTCLVHQRLDGGPASAREYTLRVGWTIDESEHGKAYYRYWHVDNAAGPPPAKGHVLVEVNEGAWTLEPLPGKRTHFEYVNYIELGGSLWTMIVNAAVRETAVDFIKNIRALFPSKA